MNLFDIFEGAIDDLEARRIEDLNAKMDDFLARAKESNDPKYKEAMRHAYAKAKAERDSYYKLKVDEAPGAETLAHNERTAQSNLDAFDLEENNDHLKVSPHDAGAFAALKGKPYDSNPHPKGSPEHLLWSKGHNALRARKADLDEHGGGVNNNGSYIAWRNKANKEHGITKAPATVEEWKDSAPGEPDQTELTPVKEGDDHGDLDAVVFGGIDKEKKRLADLKKRDPEAYAREMAREKSRRRIPPVSTFEEDSNTRYNIIRTNGHGKKDVFAGNYSLEQAKDELAKCLAHPLHTKYGHKFEIVKRDQQGVAEWVNPAVAMNAKPLTKPTPDEQKKIDRDVKLLGKYHEKGLSLGGAAKRFNKFKAKHQNEEQGVGEGSMAAAAHNPDGPKFGGYWKGTDKAPPKPGQGFGGCEESENPMGDKELAYLIAKAKQGHSQPDPDLHKGDEHEINSDDDKVDEGIDGNMTARSNPLTQPLRKSNHAPKAVMQSGAGKHANQLKKAAAARLGEMTDAEVTKLRKDADEYAIKQMTAPKAPKKAEPKKSFMQQVGDKQIGMVKGAWKGLTGQLKESDNFLTWAIRNGYNINKPAIYESARKAFTEIKKGQKDSNGFSKCWPGKHAEGTKKGKNGGRVRNCVPNESVEEAANPAQQAAIAIAKKKKQKTDEDCGPIAPHETYYGGVDETAAWQKKSGKNKNGGLNKKGVDSYRREHPGSKLQTAVTKKPSEIKAGSKDAKRRKSFCARMSGMKGPMKKPNGEPTRKALSLKKWHCESIENLDLMLSEAISEAKNLGNRVKVVKGPEAGQMGTIGEIRPGAFKGAPGYYTVDLDNGGHIQVRKEALRLIKDDELVESLRQGEYYVWTVYFDDGTSKRIKVTSDEFDPYAYYAKQNKVVANVDYDWSINS